MSGLRAGRPGRLLLHLRRPFFDAQSAEPDAAKTAMNFILDVYRVERAALDGDVLGTPEHLEPADAEQGGDGELQGVARR